MFKRLAEPALYEAALERVASKQRKRRAGTVLACSDGPSLEQLLVERRPLSQRLARLVSRCEYTLAPLEPRSALIEGRVRRLYRASPLDLIVMSAVAEVLGAALEPGLSPRLFSYRRGYSTLGALHQAAAYMRRHVRAHHDPRTRGLYVLRRDVRAYGDSIPSHDEAPLWQLLAAALERQQLTLADAQHAWLRSLIRPTVLGPDGCARAPSLGIPTGSPLQPIIGNLYLGELDRALEQQPDAFYARFGDDLLYMHARPECAQAAARLIDEGLQQLGLAPSEGKCASLYLTAPGRHAPVPDFAGQSSFDYLGKRLSAHSQIGVSRPKARRMLQNVDRRLHNLANTVGELPLEERARLMCDAVSQALDPAALTAERTASALAHEQTDQRQLRQLDYLLALRVACALTGKRGVRALRAFAPARLRGEFGLQSLVRRRIAHARLRGERS